jgi:hypothetical protein
LTSNTQLNKKKGLYTNKWWCSRKRKVSYIWHDRKRISYIYYHNYCTCNDYYQKYSLKDSGLSAVLHFNLKLCSRFKRAILPKCVLKEGFITENLRLRECWCLLNFCTRWIMRFDALFVATFLCVNLWNRLCLLHFRVSKF